MYLELQHGDARHVCLASRDLVLAGFTPDVPAIPGWFRGAALKEKWGTCNVKGLVRTLRTIKF